MEAVSGLLCVAILTHALYQFIQHQSPMIRKHRVFRKHVGLSLH